MKDYQFILEYNSVSKTLDNNPAGWDEFTITYDRSPVYHSVFRNIGETLRYESVGVNDGGGYQFIKDAYTAEGIKALITVTINKLNGKTNAYDFFYGGILDFSPKAWNDNLKEKEFEIGIVDSSKLQQFRSNEDIEIDLNSTTSLDGTAISAFVNSPYAVTRKTIDIYLFSTTENGTFSDTTEVTAQVNVQSRANYFGELTTNEIGDRLDISETFADADELLYTNDLTQDSDFSCPNFRGESKCRLTITDNGGSWTYKNTITFILYDRDGVFVSSTEEIVDTASGTGNTDQQLNNTFTPFAFAALDVDSDGGYITMESVIDVTATGASASKTVRIVNSTSVERADFIELTDGEPDSEMYSFPPFEGFTRGLQLTTNETDDTKLLDSDVFGRTDSEFTTYSTDGDYAFYFYSIGWNVRGYTDKAFLTKYRDMFKSYDACFCLTQIYDRNNDRFIIAPRTEAYKDIEILRLDDVSEFKIEPADKYYYKQLLTGYPKQTFEEFQGVNEVNLESEHFIDMPVKGKLDIRSVATASSIVIELAARKSRVRFQSQDTKYDEQNVIVEVFLNGLLYETIQGVADLDTFLGGEQYYNWSITPRENIIRHGEFVQAPMFKHPTQNIDKSKYQKESDAEYTNQNGDLVTELSNISQTELSTLRVHPEIYTFESVWNSEIIGQLNSDPHGYITAPYEGTDYKGFIVKVEGNPSTNLATYTLIKANV